MGANQKVRLWCIGKDKERVWINNLSSSGSMTSKESQQLKKSSRGRVRVVPSRFNDSILDTMESSWLFQKFDSGLEFKDQLLRYSLKTQYDVKMAKSEATRIVVCKTIGCPWRVYCSVEIPINKWMLKVCQMKHSHLKSSRVSMLKQVVIAGLFTEKLRRNVGLQDNEIKDAIKGRYNIIVPISKCYKGRRIALDSILDTHEVQFGKLWDYEAEHRRSNPGITTKILTVPINGVQVFD